MQTKTELEWGAGVWFGVAGNEMKILPIRILKRVDIIALAKNQQICELVKNPQKKW